MLRGEVQCERERVSGQWGEIVMLYYAAAKHNVRSWHDDADEGILVTLSQPKEKWSLDGGWFILSIITCCNEDILDKHYLFK